MSQTPTTFYGPVIFRDPETDQPYAELGPTGFRFLRPDGTPWISAAPDDDGGELCVHGRDGEEQIRLISQPEGGSVVVLKGEAGVFLYADQELPTVNFCDRTGLVVRRLTSDPERELAEGAAMHLYWDVDDQLGDGEAVTLEAVLEHLRGRVLLVRADVPAPFLSRRADGVAVITARPDTERGPILELIGQALCERPGPEVRFDPVTGESRHRNVPSRGSRFRAQWHLLERGWGTPAWEQAENADDAVDETAEEGVA